MGDKTRKAITRSVVAVSRNRHTILKPCSQCNADIQFGI